MGYDIVSPGDPFTIKYSSRLYGAAPSTIFNIDDETADIEVSTNIDIADGSTLSLAGVPVNAGALTGTVTAQVAPGTPASGHGAVYEDSTSKALAIKNDAGVVSHTVQTQAAVTNKFVTAIADSGAVTVGPIPATLFLSKTGAGLAAPGSVTLTGAVIGDKVVSAINLTAPGTVTASFEGTISASNAIQQSATTGISVADVILFFIVHQA